MDSSREAEEMVYREARDGMGRLPQMEPPGTVERFMGWCGYHRRGIGLAALLLATNAATALGAVAFYKNHLLPPQARLALEWSEKVREDVPSMHEPPVHEPLERIVRDPAPRPAVFEEYSAPAIDIVASSPGPATPKPYALPDLSIEGVLCGERVGLRWNARKAAPEFRYCGASDYLVFTSGNPLEDAGEVRFTGGLPGRAEIGRSATSLRIAAASLGEGEFDFAPALYENGSLRASYRFGFTLAQGEAGPSVVQRFADEKGISVLEDPLDEFDQPETVWRGRSLKPMPLEPLIEDPARLPEKSPVMEPFSKPAPAAPLPADSSSAAPLGDAFWILGW